MTRQSFLTLLLIFITFHLSLFTYHFSLVFAQVPSPALKQTKTILLLNGTAHLGNGNVIENSAIAFSNGKITLAADATLIRIDKNAFDTIINVAGKHIYPGFIAPNSTLGLTEIDAVRATRDYEEVGDINPNIRSIIAYNTDSKVTSTVRSNGILMAQITPRGGLISGTSSIVELDAWNWEDAAYKPDDGMHLNWPRSNNYNWWGEDQGEVKKNEQYNEQLTAINLLFKEAKGYTASNPAERNLRLDAMKGLFDGKLTLYIHVNDASGIMQAVNFSKDAGVIRMVIAGGADSWRVTGFLKENNIPVIVKRLHSLPQNTDDDIDISYKLPAMLYKAGIKFCLENSGDMEAMGTRNLPFYAGTAIAYGLPKEEAVKAITSSTADILGIGNTVGAIEVGKEATIIVSSGDALDMRTNNIELAYIRGKQIDLDNHQKALYRKFRDKYNR